MTWIADAVTAFGWQFVWTYLVVVGLIAVVVMTLLISVFSDSISSVRSHR